MLCCGGVFATFLEGSFLVDLLGDSYDICQRVPIIAICWLCLAIFLVGLEEI